MKKLGLLGILVLLGCAENSWDCVQKSGDDVVIEVPFESTIKQVIIFDDINLVWHPSEDQRIELHTGANLLNDINLDLQSDSILELRNENSCRWTRKPDNVEVHVYSNQVNWIEKFGYGEIKSEGTIILDKRLDVINQGSGNISLNMESTSEVWLSVRSLGNITLSGEVSNLHIFVDRLIDSIIYAQDLVINDAAIWHAGSNDLHLNPTNILRGTMRDIGNVLLYNQPETTDVTIEGAGKILPKF